MFSDVIPPITDNNTDFTEQPFGSVREYNSPRSEPQQIAPLKTSLAPVPYEPLHALSTKITSQQYTPTSLAMHMRDVCVREEWDYCRLASARLESLRLVQQEYDPESVVQRLRHVKSPYVDYPVNLTRPYTVPFTVALNANILKTVEEHRHDDDIALRLLHAALFTVPYAATEDDLKCVYQQADRFATECPYWAQTLKQRGTRTVHTTMDIINNYWQLHNILDLLESTVPEQRKRRHLTECSDGRYSAVMSVVPLPNTAYAYVLNKVSNAIVPFLCAQDAYDMRMVLSPTTTKVRDALLRMYGMPQHDSLYPENAIVSQLLLPESVEFPLLLADTKTFIYVGTVSLQEFCTEVLPGNAAGNDYQFYAFYHARQ